jgi:hypothetical protein
MMVNINQKKKISKDELMKYINEFNTRDPNDILLGALIMQVLSL